MGIPMNESANNWNYSDEGKEGYRASITGDVVEIALRQARDFNTGKPAFYDDGNPKRNVVITLMGQSGNELCWTFSLVRKGNAFQAIRKAFPDINDMAEIGGHNITIATKPGNYNVRNPRPWAITDNGPAKHGSFRGFKDLISAPVSDPIPQSVQEQVAAGFGNNVHVQESGVYDEDIPF